jgi:hypothetical protein
MSSEDIKNMEELDVAAEGWLYVNGFLNVPSYNFKKLNEYCKKKGVKRPADLTEEEREMFVL